MQIIAKKNYINNLLNAQYKYHLKVPIKIKFESIVINEQRKKIIFKSVRFLQSQKQNFKSSEENSTMKKTW